MPDFSAPPGAGLGRIFAPYEPVHKDGQHQILWSPQILRAVVAPATQHHLFTTQLYVGVMTLFASSDNDVNVTVGTIELQPADVQVGAAFDLGPGRSATIYVDDPINERFDAEKWYLAHPDPAENQLVYVTIWTPNYL